MRQLGLTPDFIACRGKQPLEAAAKRKIAMFSSVRENAIISIHDVSNIYRVPLMMMEQNLASMLAYRLRIKPFYKRNAPQQHSTFEEHDMTGISKSKFIKEWTALADSVDAPESECCIAIVGKYVGHGDACKFYTFVY
jgi:CTP synthase